MDFPRGTAQFWPPCLVASLQAQLSTSTSLSKLQAGDRNASFFGGVQLRVLNRGVARGRQWLVASGGILIGAVVRFTFVAIVPTDKQLLDPALDRKSDRTRQLLSQWARLHAVRGLLSFLPPIIFLYVLGVDRAAQMQTGAKKRLRRPMQRRPSEGPMRLFFSRGLMFCFLCTLSSPLAFARTPERPQAKSRDPRVEEGYLMAPTISQISATAAAATVHLKGVFIKSEIISIAADIPKLMYMVVSLRLL